MKKRHRTLAVEGWSSSRGPCPEPELPPPRLRCHRGCEEGITRGVSSVTGADAVGSVCGSILDALEGGVRPQKVGDDLCALHFQRVVAQTAKGRRTEASAGHDSRKCVCGGVLELNQRFVDGEGS